MNIAFAVVFVALVCFSETARHGVFGLSPSEITASVYAALVLGAVLILRGDLVHSLVRPKAALYGRSDLSWSWGRSVLGLFLGPLLWVVPLAYGVFVLQISVIPDVSVPILAATFAPFLLIAMAEGLFLREAVVKSYSANRFHIYAISTLAVLIFHVPQGGAEAVMAAGAAIYFMTLRLIGANILIVAVVQAASMAVFTGALTLDVNGADIWTYAAYFVAASSVLSIFIYSLFSTQKGSFSYA